MAEIRFKILEDKAITNEVLESAAVLFSNNYGVWGHEAESNMGSFAKYGRRVRMSAEKLREQCLPSNAWNTYVCVKIGDVLVGNLFACRWRYKGKTICWITQLVVSQQHRRMRFATQLLSHLYKKKEDLAFGVLSSHPATVLAVLRAFGRGVEDVDLSFIRRLAAEIMELSPISYVKNARLHGSLFEDGVIDGSVSSANTQFWVDHKEPLDTLQAIRVNEIFGSLESSSRGMNF